MPHIMYHSLWHHLMGEDLKKLAFLESYNIRGVYKVVLYV